MGLFQVQPLRSQMCYNLSFGYNFNRREVSKLRDHPNHDGERKQKNGSAMLPALFA